MFLVFYTGSIEVTRTFKCIYVCVKGVINVLVTLLAGSVGVGVKNNIW